MKKYLFNMEKNGHNIDLAKNVAFNNEDWTAYEEINNILSELLANRINYRFSEVSWDIWKKATEIAQGAINYRAQCNGGW